MVKHPKIENKTIISALTAFSQHCTKTIKRRHIDCKLGSKPMFICRKHDLLCKKNFALQKNHYNWVEWGFRIQGQHTKINYIFMY